MIDICVVGIREDDTEWLPKVTPLIDVQHADGVPIGLVHEFNDPKWLTELSAPGARAPMILCGRKVHDTLSGAHIALREAHRRRCRELGLHAPVDVPAAASIEYDKFAAERDDVKLRKSSRIP